MWYCISKKYQLLTFSFSFLDERGSEEDSYGRVCEIWRPSHSGDTAPQLHELQLLSPPHVCQARNGVRGGETDRTYVHKNKLKTCKYTRIYLIFPTCFTINTWVRLSPLSKCHEEGVKWFTCDCQLDAIVNTCIGSDYFVTAWSLFTQNTSFLCIFCAKGYTYCNLMIISGQKFKKKLRPTSISICAW